MDLATFDFDQMPEGLEKYFEHDLAESEIDAFAKLSGDFSPLHIDANFARSRGFEGRVAHGALVSALISRLIGMMLPGRNAIIQSTQCNFHKPTYAGMKLEVRGKVVRRLEPLKAVMINISVSQIKGSEKIDLVSGKVQLGFTQEGTK